MKSILSHNHTNINTLISTYFDIMSSVSLPADAIARVRELFVLYAKKGAFNVEEYSDVGAVFKQVASAYETSQTEQSATLEEQAVKFIINTVNVCSSRVPTEAQNYKLIAGTLEVLAKSLEPVLELDDDESKTEL